MAARGRKRNLTREIRYWDLLSQGIGTIEACRLVRVSRKTRYRWRAEMGAYWPRTLPPRPAATCPGLNVNDRLMA